MLTPSLSILAATTPPPQGGGTQMLITMALFMVIFWVLIIRPQKKKQKEHESRLAALKTGDRIVSSGGIHGIITAVRDRTVSVKIAENVRVDLDKAAVATVLPKESESAAPAEIAK